MRCIVVDDDQLSRSILKKCIERTTSLELVGEYSSSIEASNSVLSDHSIDIMFLDVEMPEMSGLELINSLKNIPQIVIVSGKSHYAAAAYDYNVTDYIVKPVDYSRFLQSIEKVNSVSASFHTPENVKDHIFLKKNKKLERLAYSEILYVEAYSDYVNIYTTSDRFTILSTMRALENKLPSKDFIRVHRSFFVRIDRILSLEDNEIEVEGKHIPLSRTYKEDFMKRLTLM
jgi:DNA-binding LytR/AlgR family response regulator